VKTTKWTVVFHPAFRSELRALPASVYDKLLSFAVLESEFEIESTNHRRCYKFY